MAGGLAPEGASPSGALRSAEIYVPADDAWELTGSLREPRGQHTASNTGPTFLNTAERYDPNRGVWRAEVPLSYPHYSHTATLLGEGGVLIAGGFDGYNYVSNVDLFAPGF